MQGSSDPEQLFVRLYLDRHITPRLAADLVQRGFDALTTQDAGLDTALDQAQLEFAAGEGRAILTNNIGDFARLHREWLSQGVAHSGIIVSRQLSNREYGTLLRRVLRLLDSESAQDMTSQFVHLEQFK